MEVTLDMGGDWSASLSFDPRRAAANQFHTELTT